MINLLSNAIKFSPSENSIIIIADIDTKGPSKVTISITVKDKGIGISKQDLKEIFKPYFRTSSELSKKLNRNGYGLGLSTC